MYETNSRRNQSNPVATKMFSYLLNPCIIYDDRPIVGDVILRITTAEKMQLKDVMEKIESVYAQKDTGEIPADIKAWCKSRSRMISEKIAAAKENSREHKLLTSIKTHVKKSAKSYGKHVPYTPGAM